MCQLRFISVRARCQVLASGRIARCAGQYDTRADGPYSRMYDLYSGIVRNYGEQASVRKVAIPKVLKVLLMFLLQNVRIRNSSPNPELELPCNNLPKRLFGWNTA